MGDKDSPLPLHTLEEENAHLKYLNFFSDISEECWPSVNFCYFLK